MGKRPNPDKAARHEAKGDALLAKGKLVKALKQYRKALEQDPNRTSIYDKLIQTRDQMPGEWKIEDFAESVSWTMQKQEQQHPPIRQVHARFTPEWEAATDLVMKILASPDKETKDELIEKLVAMGEISTRATIGLLLDFTKAAEAKGERSQEGEQKQND
jgi:tetratricopeptide (TPR) repeat protein